MVTVLRTYVPGVRDADQVASAEAFDQCVTSLDGYFYNAEMTTQRSYATALQWHWGDPGELVVVEQDVVMLPEHLYELLACESPTCVFAYDIYPVRDSTVTPECVHRVRDGDQLRPLELGEEDADVVGLGCAKLDELTRRSVVATPAVPLASWNDLAAALSARLDCTWHVHWPKLVHDHYPVQALA